jgi:penicillin-binding protein 1A
MGESTRDAGGNYADPSASSSARRSSSWAYRLGKAVTGAFGLLVGGALALLMLVALALAVAYPNLPELSGLADYRPKQPMRVYAADGVLLGEFGDERRSFVASADMPKSLKNAVLAIEDARFYEHSGVDYLGVLRAGLANFGESRSQGASTITMQVARNFYLSTEKTFTRKIYEILLSLKIESQLSKDQILELYMNQIYLGQRAYGFASASEVYFNKPLSALSIGEMAMLAGLPKAPSAYNPIANPKRATVRQLYIIDRMLENGFITAAERDAARAEKLVYRAPSETLVHAEYAAETARQMVYAQYGDDAYTLGLHVYLTIKSTDQVTAYQALRRGILDYERRQVYRGPEAYIDLPANPIDLDTRVAEALAEHPDSDELKAAVVLQAGPRKLVASLQNGEVVTVNADGLRAVASGLADKGNPKTQIRRGAVVRLVKSERGHWSATQLPEVEGAFIALDPRSGAIQAMVGGFDYGKAKFNHVTQAWRQPGSSLKPFIYSAALEKGFSPATVINDAPLFFDADSTGSQPWEPKNYDGNFDGPMSMRRGLAKSKNMVSIRILKAIGPPFAQAWTARFGFDADKNPAYLTLALGAGAVTPLQMATGYGVFANGGYRLNPYLISRVVDTKGRVVREVQPPVLDESMRVIEPRNAFVMNSLLQEVTRTGTAARAQSALRRHDVYGKTGTTNDSLDAWFAGYQRDMVAVVWMGYDNPRKLGDHETGGGLTLPIWIDYMATALKGHPVSEPQAPEGVANVNGEWYFEEFLSRGGVKSLGLRDRVPTEREPDSDEERQGILDLFTR